MPDENVFRVTDAWVTGEDSVVQLELDFAGVSNGSEQREARPGEFAVVAAAMSQGKPVYFSRDLDAISTDPFFGSQPPDPQEFTEPVVVMDVDLVWGFKSRTGMLMLTLGNRSVAHFEVSDPSLLAGWVLTCETHPVVFDGSTLKSRRDLGI